MSPTRLASEGLDSAPAGRPPERRGPRWSASLLVPQVYCPLSIVA